MEPDEFHEAVDELLRAQDVPSARGVIQRHPILLEESTVSSLAAAVESWLGGGGVEEAAASEKFRATVEFLKEIAQEPEPATEEERAQRVVSLVSAAPWASLVRGYLALRRTATLEQAIETAQEVGDERVAVLIRALLVEDLATIDAAAPDLYREFRAAGRESDALTVALVGLDMRARLAQTFDSYPPEQRAEVVEVGLNTCRRAWAFAALLGDWACQAFYRMLEAIGCVRWNRPYEAAVASQEAVEHYQRLAQQWPQTYEPAVAEALNAFGTSLRDLRRLDEAEAAHREALRIRRALAENDPSQFNWHVSISLHNLGIVLFDANRLEEAERVYRELLELRRELVKEDPQAYEPALAMSLKNFAEMLNRAMKPAEGEAAAREALAIYRQLAQSQMYEADVLDTLIGLASLLTVQRRFQEAEGIHREVVETYRSLARKQPQLHRASLVLALNNLGTFLYSRRSFEEAETILREALELRRALARNEPRVHDPDVAMTLFNLALVLKENRRLDEAAATAREALEAYRLLAQAQPGVYESEVASSLNTVGGVLHYARRLDESEGAYREALSILRPLARERPQLYEKEVAMTLSNLGLVLREMRRFGDADGVYREALELLRALPQSRARDHDLLMTLNNLGNVFWESWRLAEAEGVYREALALCRSLAQEEPETYDFHIAMTLNNLGLVLTNLERYEEGEAAFRNALDSYRRLARAQPRSYEQDLAMALTNLGNVAYEQGRLAESESLQRESLDIYRRYDRPTERAKVLFGIARVRMAEGAWDAAIESLREAAAEAEHLRTEVQSLERRRQIFKNHIHIFGSLVICLMKTGRHLEALEAAERGKSRTLIDLLSLRDSRPQNIPPELAEEYARALIRLRALDAQLGGLEPSDMPSTRSSTEDDGGKSQQLEAIQWERVKATRRVEELLGEVRKYDPAYVPYANTLDADAIKRLAAESDSTLALFSVTDVGTYIFLVFPDGKVEVVTVPSFDADALYQLLATDKGQGAHSGWVRQYYEYIWAVRAWRREQAQQGEAANVAAEAMLRSRRDWLTVMESMLLELDERLMVFIRSSLSQHRGPGGAPVRVVIVPNRGLAILPLHACARDEEGRRHYFFDDHTVSYAPSLSVYKLCLERERAGRPQETAMVVADPTGDLVSSDWESDEIQRMLGGERVLVLRDEEATKGAVLSQSGGRGWLHFSCHGEYRLGAPFESALALSGGELLTLGEILDGLDLRQNWLTVLSACETSLVDFREVADEYYGLPVGFLFAGAPTVWGTLWTVSGQSTALLMIKAYEVMTAETGVSKSDALRLAQLWLRDVSREELLVRIEQRLGLLKTDSREWSWLVSFRRHVKYCEPGARPFAHPYYWAGIQCVGA